MILGKKVKGRISHKTKIIPKIFIRVAIKIYQEVLTLVKKTPLRRGGGTR